MTAMANLLTIALKSAWRNLHKNFSYSLFNLIGLALTFACLILIFSYLHHENNFESFHTNKDRIFRPTYRSTTGDFSVHWARVPVDYINQLPQDIPEVEKLVRFQNQEQRYFRVGEKRFKPKHAYITDPYVFEVFDFKLLSGDLKTALSEPHSVIISKKEAIKIFSQTDVIGQEIFVTGDWSPDEQPYTITGVMQDLPSKTHLPVEMLFSFTDDKERSGWAYVYIQLKEHARISEVEKKISSFIDKYQTDPNGPTIDIQFQPLADIHLQSHLAREIRPNGQRIYLTIFFWFGIFIWIIAMVNFSNINLALTLSRGKEVGVRKVLGADRKQIGIQMVGETFFHSFTGLLLGCLLAFGAFPYLEQSTNISQFPPYSILLPFLLLLGFITALATALLPVTYISSLKIIQALKYGQDMNIPSRNRKINFRKGLIGIQFFAALVLVTGTLITYSQFQFIRHKNLGFSKDQILAIPGVPNAVVDNYPLFKERISKLPGVSSVSACMQVPSDEIRDTGPVMIRGEQQDPNQAPQMDIQIIDPDFTELMQLRFLAGNPLDSDIDLKRAPEFTNDFTAADYLSQAPRKYIINETALHQLGWDSPNEAIGKEINFSIGGFNLDYGPIVGVVEDYHQESLRNKIDPTIMVVESIWLQTFLVKLNSENIDQTLAQIESNWNDLFPYTFDYHFLDELFDNLYQQDQVQIQLLGILSMIAVAISLIGLMSLLAYTLRRRAKELAIRRVIGATQFDLAKLVGKEYILVMIVSAAIALPATLWWGKKWLNNFAYHTLLSPMIFILTIGGLILLLILIITWQTKRASAKNPVYYLRDE